MPSELSASSQPLLSAQRDAASRFGDKEVGVQAWGWATRLSLVSGPLHVVLMAMTGLCLVGLLVVRRDRGWWRRRVPLAVLAAGALVGLLVGALTVLKPWPDPLPPPVLVWIGVGFLGITLLVLGWRGRRRRVRALAVLAGLLVVLGSADGVDTYFGAFPTVDAALQLAPHDQVSAASVLRPTSSSPGVGPPSVQSWRPPPDMPRTGAVTQVDIPATRSGFPARAAWLYVPPAYRLPVHPLMPVLIMIGGQPGGTRDWLDGGQLAQQMDQWAAAHGGLAPVVVMPDALGSPTANPLCMDSALGKADTYLSSDVVSWVTSSLRVQPDHAHWAVGGFSYGGTCALQLAVAHPDLFPTFFDVSGQQAPTLGGHAHTVAAAFGGDERAFAAVDPLHELAVRAEPGSAGFLVVGAQDGAYRRQQLAVAAAARAAGVTVTYQELPGGHSWDVWRPALTLAIPWLAAQMGLPS